MTPTDPLIVLSPGAQILLRGTGAIQFGIDASRAGIVELPEADSVAQCLKVLEQPTRIDDLLTALAASGLDSTVARCLIDDLLAFGIALPIRPAEIFVLGGSRLASRLSRLARSVGVSVRIPLAEEEHVDALATLPPHWPVVLVDQVGRSRRIAAQVAALENPVLSVSALDARGLVGPIRLGVRGPCPLCIELHWVRQDSDFITVASGSSPLRQDPVAVAATAAAAVGVIQTLVGMRPDASPLVEGECLLVDPYAPDRCQRFLLPPHPGCPVCFEAAAGDLRAA